MEHRSLIWGLVRRRWPDGISSLEEKLSSDNVTCGRSWCASSRSSTWRGWCASSRSSTLRGWCASTLELDWNCMQRIYQLWRVTTPCRALKHYPSPRLTQIDYYRSNLEKSQHHQPPCCFWLRDRCEELRKGWMCHLKPNWLLSGEQSP